MKPVAMQFALINPPAQAGAKAGWRVTLTREGKTMELDYSTRDDTTPDWWGVMYYLAASAQAIEKGVREGGQGLTFERKQAQAEQFRALMGDDYFALIDEIDRALESALTVKESKA